MDTFQTILSRKLTEALAALQLPNVGDVTQATDARFGDYQTNAALVLAKQRGENPRELAAKIVAALQVEKWSETPTIAGAGFVNFRLRPEAIARQAAQLFRDDRLGVDNPPVARIHHDDETRRKPESTGEVHTPFHHPL